MICPFRSPYNAGLMTVSLLFSLYCLEAGLFFLLAPWTHFWNANPLVQYSETLSVILTNGYVRGLFSGFGLVHLLVGAGEIKAMLERRRQASEP